MRGGSKPGERRGGRQKGTKNKQTEAAERALADAAAKITAALGENAFEGDAHAYLVSVYKDPDQPTDLRVKAAVAAIPYEKPRLAAIEGNKENRVITIADLVHESMCMRDVTPTQTAPAPQLPPPQPESRSLYSNKSRPRRDWKESPGLRPQTCRSGPR